MSVVAEYLSKISLGEPQSYKNLTLFPLISDKHIEPNYLLLDEALEKGGRVSPRCLTREVSLN